ncbi:hypothetical protein LCGC14_1129850 [marine sediment metagenome]|uniref:Uncharacterized protein n=1 Tax=marine sediment metagenome TaxID=412755 RepID=A0A0F9PJM7_9ZZZZ
MLPRKRLTLIAYYNPHAIYMGWHLYLRERRDRRNADGGWGWVHGGCPQNAVQDVLTQLGFGRIEIGGSDGGTIATFATRCPNGVRLDQAENGTLYVVEKPDAK